MNVLYWNVCNAANNQEIINETKKLMESGDIEVACLQEVPYETVVKDGKRIHVPLSDIISADLGAESHFEHTRTVRRSKKKLSGYGTAIISRSGFVEVGSETIRDDALAYMTPGKDNRRVVITATPNIAPDTQVSVAHLSYAIPLKRAKLGMKKEQEALKKILAEKLNQGRLIFGGDLNAKPGGGVDDLLSALHLKGIVDPLLHTFRSRHWYAGYLKRNLDRVFVSSDLKATASVDHPRQSDHRPVIVHIED